MIELIGYCAIGFGILSLGAIIGAVLIYAMLGEDNNE